MLGDYSQVITWLLIITGWFLINKQHNDRELRKERRATIDALKDEIYNLEEKSIKYHTEAQSTKASQAIKQTLEKIEFQIELHCLVPMSIKNERVAALSKAITFKNFDTLNYKNISIDDPIIKDINHAVTMLIRSVEWQYRVNYPI